jgi:hypothetical protein
MGTAWPADPEEPRQMPLSAAPSSGRWAGRALRLGRAKQRRLWEANALALVVGVAGVAYSSPPVAAGFFAAWLATLMVILLSGRAPPAEADAQGNGKGKGSERMNSAYDRGLG